MRAPILLATLTVLAALASASAQLESGTAYIMVEPAGYGEVVWSMLDEVVDRWPEGGMATETSFLTPFWQGGYLYLEARPYGCNEFVKWVLEGDVEALPTDRPERLIVKLNTNYMNVKAMFRALPEGECPYIPIWKAARIRKDHLTTLLIGFAAALLSTGAYVYIRGAVEARRAREEEHRMRVNEARKRFTSTATGHIVMAGPHNVLLYLIAASPFPDEADKEALREALTKEPLLDSYLRFREGQYPRPTPSQHYLQYTGDLFVGQTFTLGLKTYLASLNIIPSSLRVIEDWLLEVAGEGRVRRDRDAVRRLVSDLRRLIRERHDLQAEGLSKVAELLEEDPEYAHRFYNPHPYYAGILREIEEFLGIRFRGLNLGEPEKPEAWRREERRPGKEEKPPREEAAEAERLEPTEEEKRRREKLLLGLPDNVRFPEELAEALGLDREGRPAAEAPPTQQPETRPEKPLPSLPKHLERQIEALRISKREVIEAAKRAGGDHRQAYREADRLASTLNLDEESRISATLTLINLIEEIAWILEGEAGEAAVKEVEKAEEGEKPPPLAEKDEAEPAKEGAERPGEGGKEEPAAEHKAEETPEKVEAEPAVEGVEGREAPEAKKVEEAREYELREQIQPIPGTVYLVRLPGAEWIPATLLQEILKPAVSKPIRVEERRVSDVLQDVKRVYGTGNVPVLIIGRPGYVTEWSKGRRRRGAYVFRLRQLLRELGEIGILKGVSILLSEEACLDYAPDILNRFSKVVLLCDPEKAEEEVSGKVPPEALPYLSLAAAVSPWLRSCLKRGLKWAPAAIGEEADALRWAVETILRKRGPPTPKEVEEAGFGKQIHALRVLGMVEEVGG